MKGELMKFRILIMGSSGSGCSSLGDSLSDSLKIPHLDGDDYYWKKTNPPYQEKNSINERQSLLKKDLKLSTCWIFSGSPASWAPFIFVS